MGAKEPLEYEQMRLFNLFSEEEIRQIHKKRKLFEFQIELSNKQIKDFLEYIKYERKLIKDIKERIQKQNIMEEDKMVPSIAVRIKQIYSKALAIFSQSARFWDEYIKFLQQFKFYDKISEALQRMLKIHDDKPEVWCRAIHWEHHENFEEGRFNDLMKSAKLKHPDSLSVFLTIFQVELEEKRKRNVNEAIEYLDECYRKGKVKFPQIEFYFGMLQIVDKLSYARSMQQIILVDVRMEYLHNELLWHTLAQRELHGMTVNDNFKSFADEHHQEDDDSKSSFSKSQSSDHSVSLRPMRTRIKACVETYKEGIDHVDSAQMWKYYLDCMLELNKDLTTQLTLKKAILNDAVHFAKDRSIQMSEEQYIKYIEIISKHKARDDYIKAILQKATMLYTTSATLWLQRLRFFMQRKDFNKVKETFCESRNYLEERGAEIWRWYFIYIKSHAAPSNEYERFVFDLANQRNPDFNIIKSYVLELLENTKGYDKAMETCVLFLRYCPQCPIILKWKIDLQTRYKELDRLIGGQTEIFNGANGIDNKKKKSKAPKVKKNGRINSKRTAQLKIRDK